MKDNRPFLDFKAIKARIPIMAVLARYGVKLTRMNQTTFKGNCPLPSHGSQSRGTFFVNDEKAVWYCHSASCKKNGDRAGGNALDLVAAIENISAYEAARRLEELFPLTGNAATPTVTPIPDSESSSDGSNQRLGFKLKDIDPTHPLIQERRISIETARSFGIGYFPGKGSMHGRIVFPLHEQDHLIGYAGRATMPVTEQHPKWLIGKGIRKTFLYGMERCDPAKPIVLVESFWGPPFFAERGIQAAATMGTEMTTEQENCLSCFSAITIAFDSDAAGRSHAASIRDRLKARHRVTIAWLKD